MKRNEIKSDGWEVQLFNRLHSGLLMDVIEAQFFTDRIEAEQFAKSKVRDATPDTPGIVADIVESIETEWEELCEDGVWRDTSTVDKV